MIEEAKRLLAASSGHLSAWEHPGEAVIWEALDWHVPGRGPHWTLPDEPAPSGVTLVGQSIRAAAMTWGVPFLDRISTKARILEIAALGESRVVHDARFTIACGAMSAARPDLARRISQPFGAARRESAARLLGLAD